MGGTFLLKAAYNYRDIREEWNQASSSSKILELIKDRNAGPVIGL